MNRLKLSLFVAGSMLASHSMTAQQTLVTYNPMWDCGVTLDTGDTPDNLRNLVDGNDMTTFSAGKADGVSILFQLKEPCIPAGLNIVAGSDIDKAPTKFKLYGRYADGDDWSTISINIRSIKYTAPFCPSLIKVQGGAKVYTQYKLEITGAQNSEELEIAEIELLALPEDNSSLANAANGSFTASATATDLSAADGSNPATGVTFRNVRAADGVENAWLQYDFDTPTAIKSYSITACPSTSKSSRPTAWELMASEDGENWVTLDTRSNETTFDTNSYLIRRNISGATQTIDFGAVCDNIHQTIMDKFYVNYGKGKYLIAGWNSDPTKLEYGYNYWWMAHAVDAYVDAFIRTKNRIYQSRALMIREGMYTAYDAGRYDLWNSFYDDMEWMNLACIRAYENCSSGNAKWLEEAKQLFEWIWGGWNYDNGSEGGIRWNSGTGTGKNSCSNAPAIIGAAKLYQITGEQDYLDKAIMIHDWMLTHSRFDDGFIKDAPDNDNRGWTFSYNQGTWVGGLLELYRITGEQKYYDVAVDLIDKSIYGKWFSPDGIMREDGDGDGGLFKGIYIRYITNWVLSGFLDPERQYRYAQYLVENARSLYNCALHKDIWKVIPNWKSRPSTSEGKYHSSILLSGLFLCESVNMMKSAGLLNDDYTVINPAAGKPYSHYRIVFTDNARGSNVQIGGFGLYSDELTAIETIPAAQTAGNINIHGANGMIEVTGAESDATVAVYTADGRCVATTDAAHCPVECPQGIYIVRVSGTQATATAKIAL